MEETFSDPKDRVCVNCKNLTLKWNPIALFSIEEIEVK
jgi:hypothetical protein